MPQIFMIVGPEVCEEYSKAVLFTALEVIGKRLIEAVEEEFGIQNKQDVAFTAVSALYTINETPIQIEVKYTAGEDEYGKGEPFDPMEVVKKHLAQKIQGIVKLWECGLTSKLFPVSVWIRPQYKSVFRGA